MQQSHPTCKMCNGTFYKNVTGKNVSYQYNIYKLDKRYLKHSKYELEKILNTRKNLMVEFTQKAMNFIENERFLSIEEGKTFVKELDEKFEKVKDERASVCKQIVKDFNKMLEQIGLIGWETVPYEVRSIQPRYEYTPFEISKRLDDDDFANLHIYISYENKKFEMCVGSSVSGADNINDNEKMQYQQFKAYVTIFDNAHLSMSILIMSMYHMYRNMMFLKIC